MNIDDELQAELQKLANANKSLPEDIAKLLQENKWDLITGTLTDAPDVKLR